MQTQRLAVGSLSFFLLTASACVAADRAGVDRVQIGQENRVMRLEVAGGSDGFTVVQPLNVAQVDVRRHRFVRVEISNVVNPKLTPVHFTVHFRPPAEASQAEQILLGEFGLFPPDNPGVFIVSVAGRIRSDGDIVLIMRSTEDVESPIEVTIKSMSLE